MIFPILTSKIFDLYRTPPTLYSILESIVNYGKDDKTKIKDLALEGRKTIFNFTYPLSDKVKKEDFECMILNNFLMRRIGFETVTAFQIRLNVKLNEIMPLYNKMFDMLDGWNIFEDGETITRDVKDNRTIDVSATDTNKTTSNGTVENEMNTSSETSGNNTSDKRASDTPQDEIEDVKSGAYVSDYSYIQDNNKSNDKSENKGTSTSNNITDTNGTNTSNTQNNGTLTETTKRTQADKLRLYTEFIEKRKNIYTMIFKDLDCLFYQLV